MRDPVGTPWWLVIAVLLLPVCAVAVVGALAFRRLTPLVFHCRRCDREFHRPPFRRFPAACPHCHARDWNAAHANPAG